MSDSSIIKGSFPKPLVQEMDDYAARLRERFPGLKITRSGILRILVERGLRNEQWEGRYI